MRRIFYYLFRFVLWGSVTLLVVLALALTWLSREETLRWALQELTQKSGGTLVIKELNGSLWRGVQMRDVELTLPSWKVKLDHAELRWFFIPPKRLQIPTLSVHQLQIEKLHASNEAATLPSSLALPLALHLNSVSIDELHYQDRSTASPSAPLIIKKLQAEILLKNPQHDITLKQVEIFGFTLHGAARIATTAPFDLQADLEAALPEASLFSKAQLQAQGTLEKLKLEARGVWLNPKLTPLQGRTTLEPFKSDATLALQLQAQALPLQAFTATPLQAVFDAQAQLQWVDAALKGRLQISNRQAGRFDQQRLPLQQLQAQFTASSEGAQIQFDSQWLSAVHVQGDVAVDRKGLISRHLVLNTGEKNKLQKNSPLQGQLTYAWQSQRYDVALHLKQWDVARVLPLFSSQALPAPLVITGEFSAQGVSQHLEQLTLDLQSGSTRLIAGGSFGTPQARLSLALSAPQLQPWSAWVKQSLDGSLELNAVLGGTLAEPLLAGTLNVHHLRLGSAEQPTLSVKNISGTGQVVAGQVSAAFTAQHLKSSVGSFSQALLTGHGALKNHEFTLQAQGVGAAQPVQADIALAGGWFENEWRGQVRKFDNLGRYGVQLQAPALLKISAGEVQLQQVLLGIAQGKIQIDQVRYQHGAWDSSGSIQALSVQALSRWFPALAAPRNTLTLGGNWQAHYDTTLNAQFQLGREQGDIWPAAVSNTSLGIERFSLNAKVVNNALNARFDLAAKQAGQVQMNLDTTLSTRDGKLGIEGSTPLRASARGEMTSLAWLGLLTDLPLSAEGRISLDASASGTLENPQLQGYLNGDDLVLRSFDPRATLRNGRVRLALENQIIYLREFNFSGRSGTVSASGKLDTQAHGEHGLIDIKLDRLDALTDPLYRVVMSGQVQIGLNDLRQQGSARISGQLRADEARITLRDTTAPALSSDVTVLKQETQDQTKVSKRAFPVDVALQFNFGEQFDVVGFGAEARLNGAVNVQAKAGERLRIVGNVNTTRGSYYAYGQSLSIERGNVNFNGTLDNPGINFYATRPNLPVEVGVEVAGSVLSPKITLISKPEMPTSEKLSWLALGRGIEDASRNDLQVLSLAASALLGPSDSLPLTQRLAKTVGLDDFSVHSGTGSSGSINSVSNTAGTPNLEETIVSVGKRLSKNVYASFERSLSGTSTLAKLRYEVARRWYIQTLTGTENAADIFFTFNFD